MKYLSLDMTVGVQRLIELFESWSFNTEYFINQSCIIYNNKVYKCKETHISSNVFDETKWDWLIAFSDSYKINGIDIDNISISDRNVYIYSSDINKFIPSSIIPKEYDKGNYSISYIYDTNNKLSSETITGSNYSKSINYTYYQEGQDIGKLETETIIEDGKTVVKTYTYVPTTDLISSITVTKL